MFPLILIIVYGFLFKTPLLNAPTSKDPYVLDLTSRIENSIPVDMVDEGLAYELRKQLVEKILNFTTRELRNSLRANPKIKPMIDNAMTRGFNPKNTVAAQRILSTPFWDTRDEKPKITDEESGIFLIRDTVNEFVERLREKTGIELGGLDIGAFDTIQKDVESKRYVEILRDIEIVAKQATASLGFRARGLVGTDELRSFKGETAYQIFEDILSTIFSPEEIAILDGQYERRSGESEKIKIPQSEWDSFCKIRKKQEIICSEIRWPKAITELHKSIRADVENLAEWVSPVFADLSNKILPNEEDLQRIIDSVSNKLDKNFEDLENPMPSEKGNSLDEGAKEKSSAVSSNDTPALPSKAVSTTADGKEPSEIYPADSASQLPRASIAEYHPYLRALINQMAEYQVFESAARSYLDQRGNNVELYFHFTDGKITLSSADRNYAADLFYCEYRGDLNANLANILFGSELHLALLNLALSQKLDEASRENKVIDSAYLKEILPEVCSSTYDDPNNMRLYIEGIDLRTMYLKPEGIKDQFEDFLKPEFFEIVSEPGANYTFIKSIATLKANIFDGIMEVVFSAETKEMIEAMQEELVKAVEEILREKTKDMHKIDEKIAAMRDHGTAAQVLADFEGKFDGIDITELTIGEKSQPETIICSAFGGFVRVSVRCLPGDEVPIKDVRLSVENQGLKLGKVSQKATIFKALKQEFPELDFEEVDSIDNDEKCLERFFETAGDFSNHGLTIAPEGDEITFSVTGNEIGSINKFTSDNLMLGFFKWYMHEQMNKSDKVSSALLKELVEGFSKLDRVEYIKGYDAVKDLSVDGRITRFIKRIKKSIPDIMWKKAAGAYEIPEEIAQPQIATGASSSSAAPQPEVQVPAKPNIDDEMEVEGVLLPEEALPEKDSIPEATTQETKAPSKKKSKKKPAPAEEFPKVASAAPDANEFLQEAIINDNGFLKNGIVIEFQNTKKLKFTLRIGQVLHTFEVLKAKNPNAFEFGEKFVAAPSNVSFAEFFQKYWSFSKPIEEAFPRYCQSNEYFQKLEKACSAISKAKPKAGSNTKFFAQASVTGVEGDKNIAIQILWNNDSNCKNYADAFKAKKKGIEPIEIEVPHINSFAEAVLGGPMEHDYILYVLAQYKTLIKDWIIKSFETDVNKPLCELVWNIDKIIKIAASQTKGYNLSDISIEYTLGDKKGNTDLTFPKSSKLPSLSKSPSKESLGQIIAKYCQEQRRLEIPAWQNHELINEWLEQAKSEEKWFDDIEKILDKNAIDDCVPIKIVKDGKNHDQVIFSIGEDQVAIPLPDFWMGVHVGFATSHSNWPINLAKIFVASNLDKATMKTEVGDGANEAKILADIFREATKDEKLDLIEYVKSPDSVKFAIKIGQSSHTFQVRKAENRNNTHFYALQFCVTEVKECFVKFLREYLQSETGLIQMSDESYPKWFKEHETYTDLEYAYSTIAESIKGNSDFCVSTQTLVNESSKKTTINIRVNGKKVPFAILELPFVSHFINGFLTSETPVKGDFMLYILRQLKSVVKDNLQNAYDLEVNKPIRKLVCNIHKNLDLRAHKKIAKDGEITVHIAYKTNDIWNNLELLFPMDSVLPPSLIFSKIIDSESIPPVDQGVVGEIIGQYCKLEDKQEMPQWWNSEVIKEWASKTLSTNFSKGITPMQVISSKGKIEIHWKDKDENSAAIPVALFWEKMLHVLGYDRDENLSISENLSNVLSASELFRTIKAELKIEEKPAQALKSFFLEAMKVNKSQLSVSDSSIKPESIEFTLTIKEAAHHFNIVRENPNAYELAKKFINSPQLVTLGMLLREYGVGDLTHVSSYHESCEENPDFCENKKVIESMKSMMEEIPGLLFMPQVIIPDKTSMLDKIDQGCRVKILPIRAELKNIEGFDSTIKNFTTDDHVHCMTLPFSPLLMLGFLKKEKGIEGKLMLNISNQIQGLFSKYLAKKSEKKAIERAVNETNNSFLRLIRNLNQDLDLKAWKKKADDSLLICLLYKINGKEQIAEFPLPADVDFEDFKFEVPGERVVTLARCLGNNKSALGIIISGFLCRQKSLGITTWYDNPAMKIWIDERLRSFDNPAVINQLNDNKECFKWIPSFRDGKVIFEDKTFPPDINPDLYEFWACVFEMMVTEDILSDVEWVKKLCQIFIASVFYS